MGARLASRNRGADGAIARRLITSQRPQWVERLAASQKLARRRRQGAVQKILAMSSIASIIQDLAAFGVAPAGRIEQRPWTNGHPDILVA